MKKQLKITVLTLIVFLVAGAQAYATKDFNVKNNSQSFFYVNGTSGNVGIGSAFPGQNLDINGTARMTGFTLSNNGAGPGYIIVGNSVGVGTWMSATTLPGAGSGSSGWTVSGNNVYETAGGNVGIGTNLVTTAALTVMNGNVGIGTWKPSGALEIEGGNVGIGTANPTSEVAIANGTLSGANNTSNFLNVTGTLNAINTGSANGVRFAITGNGSSSFIQEALNATLNAGYTGSSPTYGLAGTNNSAGTGINYGGILLSEGSSTGINLGAAGEAISATTNIGGYFALTGTIPSFSNSAALVADNGVAAAPIFVARVNGTEVDRIDQNGNVGLGTSVPGAELDVEGTLYPTVFYGHGTDFNVGIGSSAPGQQLDINGTARMTGFTLTNEGASNGYVLVTNNVGVGTWMSATTLPGAGSGSSGWTVSGNNVYETAGGNVGIGTTLLTTAALTVMNGNVGIGTWVPNALLNLGGTALANQAVIQIGSRPLSDANGAYIAANLLSTDSADFIRLQSNLNANVFNVDSGGNVGASSFATGTTGGFHAGDINYPDYTMPGGGSFFGEVGGFSSTGDIWALGYTAGAFSQGTGVLYWTPGNVGIGTSRPGSTFSVNGSVGIGTANSSYVNIAAPAGGMIVQGNVGIGSLTPGQALDVTGTVRAIGLSMSGSSPISGYVLTASDSAGDATWSSAGGISGWTVTGNNVYETGLGNVGIGTFNPFGGGLIVTSGNVGIGSLTPGQLLDVKGTVRVLGNGGLIVNNGNVGIGTSFINGAGEAALTVMNGNVGIGTWVPGGALIVENGNVGIGTNSPQQLLHVFSALNAAIELNSSGTTSNSELLLTGDVSGENGNVVQTSSQASNSTIVTSSFSVNLSAGPADTGGLNLVTKASAPITFSTNGISFSNERMRIDQNGNVGIGSWSANTFSNKLSVVGNVGIGTGYSSGFIQTAAPNGGMIVEGNVGIGSLAPGQALDVNGTVRAIGITMSGSNPIPGYVLTASDSAGDTTWSSAGGISGWTVSGNNVYETAGGNVGIGTTLLTTAALTVMNGNVGIGTWVPGESLDIEGAGAGIGVGTTLPSTIRGYWYSPTTSNIVALQSGLATGFSQFNVYGDIGGLHRGGMTYFNSGGANTNLSNIPDSVTVYSSFSATGGLFITAGGAAPITFVTGGVAYSNERMIIDQYGNVGIGTSVPGSELDVEGTLYPTVFYGHGTDFNVGIGSIAPGQQLDINGTARMTGFTLTGEGAGNGYVIVGNSVGVGTWMAASTLSISGGAGSSGWTVSGNNVYETAGGNVGIGTTLLTTAALTVMNGNVGIGTWVPAYSLDINGNFRTSGNTGNTTLNTTGGNVGIGSANPGQLLDAAGNIRGQQMIDTGVAAGNLIYSNSNQQLAAVTVGSGLSLSGGTLSASGGSSNYWLNDSGNVGISTIYAVGIGTTFVGGTGEASLSVMNGNVGIGTWVPSATLHVNSTADSQSTYLAGFSGSTVGVRIGTLPTLAKIEGVDKTFVASFQPLQIGGSTLDFTIASVKKMSIDANGNVGIGTWVPGQILDINGTARMTGFTLTGNGANNGYVMVGNSVGVGTWMAAATLPIAGGGGSSGWTVSGNNVYETAGGNVGIGTVIVNQAALTVMNGNVGIGTWVPAYNIAVNGTSDLNGATTINGTVTLPHPAAGSSYIEFGTLDFNSEVTNTGTGGGVNIFTTDNGNGIYVGDVGNWTTAFVNISPTFQPSGASQTNDIGLQVNSTFQYASSAATTGQWLGIRDNPTFGNGSNSIYNATSPMVGLSVNSTFNVATSSTGNYVDLLVNSTETQLGTGTSNYLAQFQNGGANKVVITSAGNVGIGTTIPVGGLAVMNGNVGIGTWVPNAPLAINAGGSQTMTISPSLINTLGTLFIEAQSTPQIYLGYGSLGLYTASGQFFQNAGTGNQFELGGLTVNTGSSYITAKNGLDVAQNVSIGTAYAGIDSAPANGLIVQGNVGIGTWVPAYSLDLVNNTQRGRFVRRINSIISSATPAINTDTTDVFEITDLSTAITSMTTSLTGTPRDTDLLEIRIVDNGSAQGITWGSSFASTSVVLPTTTVGSATLPLRVLLEWNSSTSKWECIALA